MPISSAVWLWATPEAESAIATRELAPILRTYRRIHNISQSELADRLGYDKSYVSMIETGRRTISGVIDLERIAARLGLPGHVLGITGVDESEYRAMVQFGESTVRLAELARRSGQTVEAVDELWPLVARLEARAARGHLERDTLQLLTKARTSLGVSLGTVLPEERLSSATRWTGQAVAVAEHLGNPALHALTLRNHGNELRKARHTLAAVDRLELALAVSDHPADRGSGLALICRAYGDLGDSRRFDSAFEAYQRLLDRHMGQSLLLQPFTMREIELRGLLSTGRPGEASRRAQLSDGAPAAPQWRTIERVTVGEILAATGESAGAIEAFSLAIADAERHHLPHQVQRVIRAATKFGLKVITDDGHAVLERLRPQRGLELNA